MSVTGVYGASGWSHPAPLGAQPLPLWDGQLGDRPLQHERDRKQPLVIQVGQAGNMKRVFEFDGLRTILVSKGYADERTHFSSSSRKSEWKDFSPKKAVA
ncbi:hypothetical protein N7539_006533 [Penicillium diatomitis]|uniref:Uncharacterized protein n=1 Tax=Penicillium diatomitis TaxID=2819901 RepID=A0A9W9X363_9EURO|nr:uncharacterized protein N7539_006533 [Penicillium diatomitis]KAJ5483087.1 hypothetical protein N7539_006533 [Penicillium diatomitis]